MRSRDRCSTSSITDRRRTYDLSSLTVLLSGGAPLSANLKDEFLAHLPTLMIVDGLGSSEAGGQVSQVSTGGDATTGTFTITPGNRRALGRPRPGARAGRSRDRLARQDAAGSRSATSAMRPRRRARTRWSTASATPCQATGPGCCDGGIVELHGRDSVTINSGGEKIFAEEVEAAIKSHPGVYDCVVAGRPSERWGNEVVAIVQGPRGSRRRRRRRCVPRPRSTSPATSCPRRFVFVDEIVRSPSGKADYRWAKQVAAQPVA